MGYSFATASDPSETTEHSIQRCLVMRYQLDFKQATNVGHNTKWADCKKYKLLFSKGAVQTGRVLALESAKEERNETERIAGVLKLSS